MQSVGRLEAHAPDPAFSDLLRDLGRDGDLGAFEHEVHLDGHVGLGQGVGREFDVDDRPGDGDHASVGAGLVVARDGLGDCGCHGLLASYSVLALSAWRSASAPPTISMISVVMASWRARFMSRVRALASSSAFSVAAAMARWRAVCSLAAASSNAPNTAAST